MTLLKYLVILAVSASAATNARAAACTGYDASDSQIIHSLEMKAVIDHLKSTFGKKRVTIKDVHHSGPQVLGLDKKPIPPKDMGVDAIAKECNYIHVYFEGKSKKDLHCVTSIEVNYYGFVVVEEEIIPLACSVNGEVVDLVVVPYRPLMQPL